MKKIVLTGVVLGIALFGMGVNAQTKYKKPTTTTAKPADNAPAPTAAPTTTSAPATTTAKPATGTTKYLNNNAPGVPGATAPAALLVGFTSCACDTGEVAGSLADVAAADCVIKLESLTRVAARDTRGRLVVVSPASPAEGGSPPRR